jgi:hypothetical protein
VLRGVRSSAAVLFALALLQPAIGRADALDDDPTPPKVEIAKPSARTELPAGTTKTTIEVTAEDEESGIGEVRLLVDGKTVRTLGNEPWVFADIELTAGSHEIVAEAVNGFVEEATSEPITIVVAAAPAPAPEEAKVEPVAAKAEPTPAPAEKADAKTPEPAKAEPAKAEPAKADPKPAASDGCFASARPRSLIGSGVAFAFAVLAGLMLRRR